MGLPRALQAHAANLVTEAEAHYRRAHQQGQVNEIFYQNFGALLKKQGKTAESEKLFEEGLQRYPHHPGILRNPVQRLIALPLRSGCFSARQLVRRHR